MVTYQQRAGVLVATIVALPIALSLAMTGCGGGAQALPPSFDDSLLKSAITDPPDDYETPIEGAPPAGVYAYPPVDILRLSIGTDDEFVFLKIEVGGMIPDESVVLEDGNRLQSIGYALDFTLSNGETGFVSFFLRLQGGAEQEAYYYSDETGDPDEGVFHEDNLYYGKHGHGWIVDGGLGHDYVVIAFRIADLMATKGLEVSMTGHAEAGTDKWKHYSFDQLSEQLSTTL